MTLSPEVRVVRIECGPLELAASFNHAIAPDAPLLRATLDIRWDEPDPAALDRIERSLAVFSPSFRRHECRGDSAYRVFRKKRSPPPDARTDPQPLDPRLALAHLIEHAVIDFESAITHATRISGVTGARLHPPGRFDLMIECPDAAVGRLCLALAVLSLTGAADARPPGRRERDLLAIARLTYRHPGRVWTSPALASACDWPLAQADAALSSLHQLGYFATLAYAMNFSGVPRFTVAPA